MTEAIAAYEPFPSFVDWFGEQEFDPNVVDRYAALLQSAKDLATDEALDAAVELATRYAAIDTGAIEGLYSVDRGFTRTVATQAASWEHVVLAKGPSVKRAIEDALEAYDFVLDAATRAVQVSEMWIRRLHEIVCASQDTYEVETPQGTQHRPLARGAYKVEPNSPTRTDGSGIHAYAGVPDTAPEMHRLVGEFQSEVFQAAHPVVQASYAHYAYVCVHPFADGNGRVARALASVYLYRVPGVPLVVFADQRGAYLDALESADAGDIAPFVAFMEARVVDAIGIVRSALQMNRPPASASVAAISAFFAHERVDEEFLAAAARLRKLITQELTSQVKGLDLPQQLSVQVLGSGILRVSPPTGYIAFGNDGAFWISASSSWPVTVRHTAHFGVFARGDGNAPSDLAVATSPTDQLEVWVRELLPTESETLKLKAKAWGEAKIAEFMDDLNIKLARAPRAQEDGSRP